MTTDQEYVPQTFYGETNTLQDALDFIYYKSIIGWKVLADPFLVKRVSVQTLDSPNLIPIESLDLWGFVLHRF